MGTLGCPSQWGPWVPGPEVREKTQDVFPVLFPSPTTLPPEACSISEAGEEGNEGRGRGVRGQEWRSLDCGGEGGQGAGGVRVRPAVPLGGRTPASLSAPPPPPPRWGQSPGFPEACQQPSLADSLFRVLLFSEASVQTLLAQMPHASVQC